MADHLNMQSKKALFNLIHFAKENEQHPFIAELANLLDSSYPVNVIPYQLRKEEIQVAKEYTYRLDSLGKTPISSLALPYLQADLPIYLLWDAPLTSYKTFFFDMANLSTKALISPHPSESFIDYAEVVLQALTLNNFSVMDIGWALSNSFRSAIRACFPEGDRVKDLQKAKTWKITCCDRQEHSLGEWQATLILHWLTSQLGFRKDPQDPFLYASSFGETKVQIEKKTNFPHFYIQFVVEAKRDDQGSLKSKNEPVLYGEQNIYELESISEKNKILCKVTQGDICFLPQVFPLKDMYKSIVHDLFFRSGGDPYKKALQALCQTANTQDTITCSMKSS